MKRKEHLPKLTESMKAALGVLLQAQQTAARLGRDKWDFACELQALKESGLNRNDLRSLMVQDLVEHAVETTSRRARTRSYRKVGNLRLFAESCFVLSAQGQAATRHLSCTSEKILGGAVPVWDPLRRELRLGTAVAKGFRQPAKNQEAILSAFQEEGWPPRIDDPLTRNDHQDAHERLRDTIKKLNRQSIFLIRFLSDGTGEGVLWQLSNRTQ